MDDTAKFILPDFLQGQDADSIQAGMLSALPDEFDKSEGGIVWDLTYPVALEKARAAQYLIPEALRAMFPRFARGQMLDMHAENRGMARKSATYAECVLRFTGADGARVPVGAQASTVATAESAAVTFITLAAGVVSQGSCEISARARVAGAGGNAAAGSVCRLDEPITGITAVTNPQAALGGVDEEVDAALRARITAFDAAQGANHVGSAADYRRWAMEVAGVGGAQVKSADDDSGLVTIIITDEQGQSASETLCQAVLNHIMRPDDPVSRLSPINAIVEVKTPLPRPISVSAHITLIGAALGDVKAAFEAALNAYFAGGHDGAVRITRVGALLSGVAGVSDYSDLLLDGGSENIELTDMQLPVLAEGGVTLT